MSDMLKLLKSLDKIETKKPLTESAVTECPPDMQMGSMPQQAPGININLSNPDDMAKLLMAIQSIQDSPTSMPNEDYTNEPEEEVMDIDMDQMSGGINSKKKMHKPAAVGDNPMAVETIKSRLMAALTEKKAKPDFLDMDKDGDKKEPMKKAIADKKKKGPVKEEQVDEISSDLAKRYTKNAKMDRDFNDDDIRRLSKSGQSTQDMHRRNSKRTKGISRAAKRIEK